MSSPEQSLLGKPAAYSDQYDPTLLFPIPRADKRAELGLSGQPPFFGADLWTAYGIQYVRLRKIRVWKDNWGPRLLRCLGHLKYLYAFH